MTDDLAIQLAAQGERADRAEQRLREAVSHLRHLVEAIERGYVYEQSHQSDKLRDVKRFLEGL